MRVAYGPDPAQFFDIETPAGTDAPPPLLVLVHGGFWREPYGIDSLAPLAADAVGRGWAVANVEYRRVGGGGGYPATFDDVVAGLDAVGAHAPVDRTRVAVFGHSAGGQLAVWAAARGRRPRGAPGGAPALRPTAVVSLAGVLDLAAAARDGLGDGAVVALLGGTPEEVPERYEASDPMRLVPVGVPLLLVHGDADRVVPTGQSHAFCRAAQDAGDEVSLREVPSGHFRVLDPAGPAWAETLAWLAAVV